MSFLLGILATALTVGGGLLAWRHRRRHVRIGFSIQPHLLAGHAFGDGVPRPKELVQLDITNVGDGPVTLTGVRMILRGETAERPVFNEGLGESWITRKPIPTGDTVFVKCSAEHEQLLDRIARVVVYRNGGGPVSISGRRARRAHRQLLAIRRK